MAKATRRRSLALPPALAGAELAVQEWQANQETSSNPNMDGQYHYDFSYLRRACEAAGLGDVLTVKPEDEENFVFKMVFTPEQQQAFAYDGAFYEGVTKWIDTSEAKIMFIYGNSDPWYSMRMHDTDNPNVKMFVNSTKPHTVSIMDFDEATMQEIGAFVSEAIPTQLSQGEFPRANSLSSRALPCRHVRTRGVSLSGSIFAGTLQGCTHLYSPLSTGEYRLHRF